MQRSEVRNRFRKWKNFSHFDVKLTRKQFACKWVTYEIILKNQSILPKNPFYLFLKKNLNLQWTPFSQLSWPITKKQNKIFFRLWMNVYRYLSLFQAVKAWAIIIEDGFFIVCAYIDSNTKRVFGRLSQVCIKSSRKAWFVIKLHFDTQFNISFQMLRDDEQHFCEVKKCQREICITYFGIGSFFFFACEWFCVAIVPNDARRCQMEKLFFIVHCFQPIFYHPLSFMFRWWLCHVFVIYKKKFDEKSKTIFSGNAFIHCQPLSNLLALNLVNINWTNLYKLFENQHKWQHKIAILYLFSC